MIMRRITCFVAALALALMLGTPAFAATFSFSTDGPFGLIATASRPESRGKIEIESADDFVLTSETVLQEATFTGLLFQGGPGEIRDVTVEIYRVFPKDSDTTRTPQVPTRMNSPSDNAFEVRSTTDGTLRFTITRVDPNFQAANSVINGIHPSPDQATGGEGPVVGQEVRFDVVFETPLDLPADHYFFVPQVQLQGQGGNFLWLSGLRPNPQFPSGSTDLQMWIRNGELDPDWLRVGQDIVDGTPFPTFNGSFSLSGETP
jgi:hypothetical protein